MTKTCHAQNCHVNRLNLSARAYDRILESITHHRRPGRLRIDTASTLGDYRIEIWIGRAGRDEKGISGERLTVSPFNPLIPLISNPYFSIRMRIHRYHLLFSRQQWIDIHLLDFRCKAQQGGKPYNNFGNLSSFTPFCPRVPLIIL